MKHHLIHRSLFIETIYPFFTVLLVLTFVLLMGRILQLMDMMINKGVSLFSMVKLILFLVPSFLSITIPIALLIAILIGMGRLSRENELLVMKSAGLSLYQLVPPIALLAVVAFILSLFLGFFVVPAGNTAGRELLVDLARQRAGIGIKEKIFNDDFPGLMLYADQVSVDGSMMTGVFIADQRVEHSPVTIIARRGRLQADPGSMGVTLRLEEGSTHMVGADLATYRKMDFAVYEIALDMSQTIAGAGGESRRDGSDTMTIGRMLGELRDAGRSAAERNVLVMDLNKRFAVPVTCVVFALIAFPLGMVRHRTAKSRGFVTGLVIVVVYYVLQLGGDALGETGKLWPAASAWGPNLILGAAGVWSFSRALAEKPLLDVEALQKRINRRVLLPPAHIDSSPPVPPKRTQRRFTAEYKRAILREAEACRQSRRIGELLRREGLSYSHLSAWRRQEKRNVRKARAVVKDTPEE
jgi:lipopolysaccharide export system permease protein